LLKKLYLWEKKDVLVERLSRGMQQKTAFICAMVLNTPVLFLDEPTLGLDIESVSQMVEFFNARELFEDRLICITSHHLEFVRKVVDDVIIIREGHLLNRYKIESLKENNRLVEVVTGSRSTNLVSDANIPYRIVKKNRNGDYLSVILDADTDSSLSRIASSFEDKGMDVYQVKRLSFDLETIYMLSHQES
jgi:ABC-type multidrug transport system ATPase subunit